MKPPWSRSHCRRLLKQGAVRWYPNGDMAAEMRIRDPHWIFPAGCSGYLRVGKHNWFHIVNPPQEQGEQG